MDHAQVQETPVVAESLPASESQTQRITRLAAAVVPHLLLNLGKIALVTVVGLAMNWGFLVLFLWTLHGSTGGESHTMALWVVGAMLGLIFPAAYVMAGQNLGAQVVMRYIYKRTRGDFQDFLIAVLRKCVLDVPQASATISRDHLRRALKQIHGMPWPVRVLLKFYVRDTSFQLLLVQMITDEAFRSESGRALKNKYGPQLDTFIMDNVIEVNTAGVWVLVTANLACAGLLFVWALLR